MDGKGGQMREFDIVSLSCKKTKDDKDDEGSRFPAFSTADIDPTPDVAQVRANRGDV